LKLIEENDLEINFKEIIAKYDDKETECL